MLAPSPRQRRRLHAKFTGLTNSVDAFRWVDSHDASPDTRRVNVLVEGDSWFAYPKTWLVHGEASNVVTSIFSRLAKDKALNGLCRASNGDTAREMMTSKQLEAMRKLLKKDGSRFDICLFSAGGNDLLGSAYLASLLREHRDGFAAIDYIDAVQLANKLDDVEKHFRTLLHLRKTHAPQMTIITHTYDFLKPSDHGAEFLWGVEIGDSWIKPTMDDKHIPPAIQHAVVKIMLERFRDKLFALQKEFEDFVVVDTQGTLRLGHKGDWLNEIHPTPSGFRRIGNKVYGAMREQMDRLPPLK